MTMNIGDFIHIDLYIKGICWMIVKHQPEPGRFKFVGSILFCSPVNSLPNVPYENAPIG